MISGHGTIETAVKSTKLGAFDFLEKPLTIPKVLIAAKNAIQHCRLQLENDRLKDGGASKYRIIGESVPMKALRQQLALMAGDERLGPDYGGERYGQGTRRAADPREQSGRQAFRGGELRRDSRGADRVRALWTRKGCFYRSDRTKAGKFQMAHEGTIFLDEIADMSLKTQAKILRILQEHKFERVGGSDRGRGACDRRDEQIARGGDRRGRFREDLYYRLNVIPFHVAPLRERREDIPLLADYFLNDFTTTYGRKPKELTPEAYAALQEYYWPGNVRELKNLMERIVIMNPQVRVDSRHIPLNLARRVPDRGLDRFGSLQEVRESAEREYILRKLEETHGNIGPAPPNCSASSAAICTAR